MYVSKNGQQTLTTPPRENTVEENLESHCVLGDCGDIVLCNLLKSAWRKPVLGSKGN